MPQPLSRVKPDAEFTYGVDALQTYPDLAAIAMETIAAISMAENARGLILAQMLNTDAHVGLSMYMSLIGTTAQKAAIAGAADAALSEEDRKILAKINKITKPAFDKRNDFAHNLWGVSKAIPNTLLLIHSKHYLDVTIERENKPKYVLPMLIDRKKVFVYRKKDLEKERDLAKNAAKLYSSFWMYLNEKAEPIRHPIEHFPEPERSTLMK